MKLFVLSTLYGLSVSTISFLIWYTIMLRVNDPTVVMALILLPFVVIGYLCQKVARR